MRTTSLLLSVCLFYPPIRFFTALKRVVFFGFFLSILGFSTAFAYDVCADDDRCTHEEMTQYGISAYNSVFPDKAYDEQTASAIKFGAGHEDVVDHIYGWHRAPEGVTVSHFWDADRGMYAQSSLGAFDEILNGGDPFPNSWQKVEQYWSLALGQYVIGGVDFCVNGFAWCNETAPYHYLGHVAHHLGDNTIPTHAHVDAHDPASGDDSFEDWMSQGAETDLGTQESAPDQPPGSDLIGELPGLSNSFYMPIMGGRDPLEAIDNDYQLPAGNDFGPVDSPYGKLYWLLYSTNQIADFFPSDDVEGDSDDREGWVYSELSGLASSIASPLVTDDLKNNDCHEDFFAGCGSGTIGDYDNNFYDNDLGVIRNYSYLRGIRATAGLLHLYEQTVSTQPILAVVIKRVEELDGCDPIADEDCDFYANVVIGDRPAASNEGDRVLNLGSDDATDISPNWAWGQAVPTTGSLPVQIYIRDEDLGDDGVVNITRVEPNIDSCESILDSSCIFERILASKILSLNVDLEKCLSGESGAITGSSFTGGSACGQTLKTDPTGDEDDDDQGIARVTFSIVVSEKTPPEIICESADGEWHADDVSIQCTASDISGLANPADASFSLWTNVAEGTETADAQTDTKEVCDTRGNCATAGPIYGNKIDKKAPVIQIIEPTEREYTHSDTLVLEYSATDAGSGVKSTTGLMNGVETVGGETIYTGQQIDLLTALPLGENTFSLHAEDQVNNVSTPAVVTFTIIVTPQSIIDAVNQLHALGEIKTNMRRPLLAKLENAQRKWEQEQCTPAQNMYGAFINHVQAQSDKHISVLAADILTTDAEYLIEQCGKEADEGVANQATNANVGSGGPLVQTGSVSAELDAKNKPQAERNMDQAGSLGGGVLVLLLYLLATRRYTRKQI